MQNTFCYHHFDEFIVEINKRLLFMFHHHFSKDSVRVNLIFSHKIMFFFSKTAQIGKNISDNESV